MVHSQTVGRFVHSASSSRRRSAVPRFASAWLLLSGATLLGLGCVERTIRITSEPSGALVRLNDEEVGRTPVDVPFLYYGTYDVKVEKNGYAPLRTAKKAQAPPWEFPGPDFFFEMVPDAEVNLDWHFTLEPEPAPDADRLIDHARQMRALTREAR